MAIEELRRQSEQLSQVYEQLQRDTKPASSMVSRVRLPTGADVDQMLNKESNVLEKSARAVEAKGWDSWGLDRGWETALLEPGDQSSKLPAGYYDQLLVNELLREESLLLGKIEQCLEQHAYPQHPPARSSGLPKSRSASDGEPAIPCGSSQRGGIRGETNERQTRSDPADGPLQYGPDGFLRQKAVYAY